MRRHGPLRATRAAGSREARRQRAVAATPGARSEAVWGEKGVVASFSPREKIPTSDRCLASDRARGQAVGSQVATRDVRLVYIQDPPPTITISVALIVRGAPGMRKSLKLLTANSSIHLQHEPRCDRFGSVAQTIVPKNSVDVRANRRIGYPDLSRNLLIREPFGHQGENLRLARREMLPPRWYQNLR